MKQLMIALLLATLSLSSVHAEEQAFKNNFAVVWNFTTSDRDLINNNIADQAAQTLDLWKQGVVENIYMDTEAQSENQESVIRIMFFIKADTREDAQKTLDEMIFVQKKIAEYSLFKVGFLWLTSDTSEIKETR